jgi:hypothetical protein
MCPRTHPLFPVFQRFPQNNGFRNIISDFQNYVYGFRNIMSGFRNIYNVSRCSSTPRVQYHCIRGTAPSHVHSCQLSRSCELQGVFGGILCRTGSLRGDPQQLGSFYNSYHCRTWQGASRRLYCYNNLSKGKLARGAPAKGSPEDEID